MTRKRLTGRQHQLLAYIETYTTERGYQPSIRDMCEEMDIRSTNGVNDHLKALAKKGYIRGSAFKSRALEFVGGPPWARTVTESEESDGSNQQ